MLKEGGDLFPFGSSSFSFPSFFFFFATSFFFQDPTSQPLTYERRRGRSPHPGGDQQEGGSQRPLPDHQMFVPFSFFLFLFFLMSNRPPHSLFLFFLAISWALTD